MYHQINYIQAQNLVDLGTCPPPFYSKRCAVHLFSSFQLLQVLNFPSSVVFGFILRVSSSYFPIRTQPIGPFHGIFDTASASEAAFTAKIVGSLSSTEITVTITCTAWRMAWSKSGRKVRSITRLANIASSEGFP